MSEAFLPGGVLDGEAVYGLSLHADRSRPATAAELAAILRREVGRLRRALRDRPVSPGY